MPHLARTHRSCVRLFLAASLVLSPVAGQAQDDTDASLGKQVFVELAEPQCAICHALADAGAAGDIGPDLDALKPTRERVSAAVINGINAMPPYGEILTEAQIEAVADYVDGCRATGIAVKSGPDCSAIRESPGAPIPTRAITVQAEPWPDAPKRP